MEVPSYEFDQLIENNAKKKYSCPMCEEIIISAHKTECNHRFCKFCITKWMMYYKDCPTCRQKIGKISPHPRTDKWIQQLFDLATPELQEDREMCINYRKLQLVKLELMGSGYAIQKADDQGKSTEQLTPATITESIVDEEPEQPPSTASTAVKSRRISQLPTRVNYSGISTSTCTPPTTETGKQSTNTSEPIFRHADDDFKAIFRRENFNVRSSPPTNHVEEFFKKPREFVSDVTLLFGAESATEFSNTFCRSGIDLHAAETCSNLAKGIRDGAEIPFQAFNERPDELDANMLNFKAYNLGSNLRTLTALALRDDVREGFENTEMRFQKEGLTLMTENEESVSHLRATGTVQGSTSETTPMSHIKAESMRARMQHEVAMASLTTIEGSRHCSSAVSPSKLSQSQKEKEDLRTCREALLNLRLRLLPPAKRNPIVRERHTFSDALRGCHTAGDWNGGIREHDKFIENTDSWKDESALRRQLKSYSDEIF